jgi:hypothetical protein
MCDLRYHRIGHFAAYVVKINVDSLRTRFAKSLRNVVSLVINYRVDA